ncbi:hypothetical protein [Mesonia sp. HuA40]|nr:hypothetical protein [Mesonia sp. HuA40]
MSNEKAIEILSAMNAWRRNDSDEPKPMPYSPSEFGEAIDHAIEKLQEL